MAPEGKDRKLSVTGKRFVARKGLRMNAPRLVITEKSEKFWRWPGSALKAGMRPGLFVPSSATKGGLATGRWKELLDLTPATPPPPRTKTRRQIKMPPTLGLVRDSAFEKAIEALESKRRRQRG